MKVEQRLKHYIQANTQPVYYHVTPTSNLPRIKRLGLMPTVGKRSLKMREPHHAIYLFRSILEAEQGLSNWLLDEFRPNQKLALLEITLPPNATVKAKQSQLDWELQVFSSVPWTYIKVLSKDVENYFTGLNDES